VEPLRVVTLNTGKCDGAYRGRIAWMVEEVRRLRPDVLACQEVFRDEAGHDTLEALKRGLGLQAAWAPARLKRRVCEGEPVDGWSGMALLSSHPWTYVDAVELPADERDGDRMAQVGLLEIGETSVVIANVHLTHLRDADALRRRQIETALSHPLLNMKQALRLVCGDFNTTPDGPVLKPLMRENDFGDVVDCYVAGNGPRERATLPPQDAAMTPRPCVDLILSLAEAPEQHPVFTSSAVVLKNRDPDSGLLPSDHYGVATTLVPLRIPSWRQERSLAF
jgi:endonuclease/exonuclease/phosphatase family metal-dependent hydrolase